MSSSTHTSSPALSAQSSKESSPVPDFFGQVSVQNMPAANDKAQPWRAFHEPKKELLDSGSVVVEIPKSNETGGYLGRSVMTGSLGGH